MKLQDAKKAARKDILTLANCYEPHRRKVLRNVKFYITKDNYLIGKFIGQAHDYTSAAIKLD